MTVGAELVTLHQRLGLAGPAFTSVFQGAIRFNTYIGVTAAIALHAAQGTALSAIAIAATIVPMVNVLSVLVFARYVSAQSGLRHALRMRRAARLPAGLVWA